MKLREVGEFGLIRRLAGKIRNDPSVVHGPGDDCAVVRLNRSQYMLLTADMLVEGVDFRQQEDPYLVGRKAIAVSLSDVAACAGVPRYALVSAGLPVRMRVEDVERLHRGMRDLANRYRLNLVGGDISRAPRLILDVSITAVVEKKNLALRSRARTGDIIFVSGSLGGSIRGKHLRFTPRLKEARWLARNFKVHAMIDISDGLVQDLRHILDSSRVGAVLDAAAIPLSPQARDLRDALYSGEDFELLFTLAPAEGRKLRRAGKNIFTPIGTILPFSAGLRLRCGDGSEKRIAPGGFRHF